MPKKKPRGKRAITNRRARFDYDLGDSLIAGLELNGREAKSLRLGHGQLQGAYVTVKDGQLWLANAAIIGSGGIPITDTEQRRTRRLLVKKSQITALTDARQQGRTIVPLEILTQGRFIKVRIAAGKGRKRYDKRQALKKRDETRQISRALKR